MSETKKYFLGPETDMRVIVRHPSFLSITTEVAGDVEVTQRDVAITELRDEITRLERVVSDLRSRLLEYEGYDDFTQTKLREAREAHRRMNESGARIVRNLREIARQLRRKTRPD